MRHQSVKKPLIAAQKTLHATDRKPANLSFLESDGRMLVILGLHALQSQNVGLSKETHNPLPAIGKVVRQLDEPRADGEKRESIFTRPVYRSARSVMELINRTVNLIEVPFLQSGKENGLPNIATEAIGDACPSFAG